MNISHEHWIENGDNWKITLASIGSYIQELSEQLQEEKKLKFPPQITQERWDSPETELRWLGPDGINRCIYISIEDDDRLLVGASAWIDIDEERVRHSTEKLISDDVEIEQLHMYLKEARKKISAIDESDLKDISPLPPRPDDY